jgi:hypothetical protein
MVHAEKRQKLVKNTCALGVMYSAGNNPWPGEQGRRLKGSLRTLGTGEHLFKEIRVPTCLVPFVADALWLRSDQGASRLVVCPMGTAGGPRVLQVRQRRPQPPLDGGQHVAGALPGRPATTPNISTGVRA